jgi:hypothetical protein
MSSLLLHEVSVVTVPLIVKIAVITHKRLFFISLFSLRD